MLFLRKPSPATIRDFLTAQARLKLTYSPLGSTATVPPLGYVVDHTRIKLGEGHKFFLAAKSALDCWNHFRLGWVEAYPLAPAIQVGQVVAVLARYLGLWSLNACRIVYLVDEQEPLKRYGFAYGTLPDHMESGEERFTVEWHEKEDAVWYDILAFSRPNHFLARLGYPLMRRLQKRFARDSVAAMMRWITLRAVAGRFWKTTNCTA